MIFRTRIRASLISVSDLSPVKVGSDRDSYRVIPVPNEYTAFDQFDSFSSTLKHSNAAG